MSNFRVALIGLLCLFITLTTGSKCLQNEISRFVVCYYNNETSIHNINLCNCTHIVFTKAVKIDENYNLTVSEDAKRDLSFVKEVKSDLLTIFTLEPNQNDSSAILKSENKSQELVNEIKNFLQKSNVDGVELNFKFTSQDGLTKESYASFVRELSKTLSSLHRRVKREGYDVFEKVQDDVTTAAYPTQAPKNSTRKAPSIKPKTRKNSRMTRDDKSVGGKNDDDSVTLKPTQNESSTEGILKPQNSIKVVQDEPTVEDDNKFLIIVRLTTQPEIAAKKFDLKALSRYANILSVPTHHLVNGNEDHVTYHPSRLMGLSDLLNTDSLLDFLIGMGALKSKIVISLPATVLKFELSDSTKNTPGSPSTSVPETVDQFQLCSLFRKDNWTLERDEDLTAPYAFSGKTWLAFEDDISVDIKGKYILLRELAGGAIFPVDADVGGKHDCNRTGKSGSLTSTLYNSFKDLGRKPRAAILKSLQEEIHDTAFSGVGNGVRLSEYRIVRIVDDSGAIHVVRKNTKTQFECSRQGYFSHPLGCNKFYRCVKFDQYSDEYTVFEYNCPVGLAFDERWEVCVWPGSLPHGAPCTGSSEIAPVPRSYYQCPNKEGYYADPENCRWFFACLDHARDGITPLTAYEFRCPFGLVFNEEKLACDWPWLVGGCGNRGGSDYILSKTGESSSRVYTANFINGGNLEASLGQYGNTEAEASFNNFGKGFGSVLKKSLNDDVGETARGSHQSIQTAGFGYIASQYDDNQRKAPFASVPDFKVSGGRILNKGGLVLDQNINYFEASGGHQARGSDEAVNYFGSRQNTQEKVQFLQNQENYRAAEGFYNAADIESKKVKSVYEISKVPIAVTTPRLSDVNQFSFKQAISTPKPFSVSISSLEGNKGASDVAFFESHQPTPKDLVNIPAVDGRFSLKENAYVQNSDVNQFSGGDRLTSQSFSVTPSSLGISFVTPQTEIGSFGKIETKKDGLAEEYLVNSAGVSGITNSPKPISVTVPEVTKPPYLNNVFSSQSGSSGTVTVSQPVVSKLGVGHSDYSSSSIRPIVNFPQQAYSSPSPAEKAINKEYVVPVITSTPRTESFQNKNSGQNTIYSVQQNSASPGIVPVTPKSNIYTYNQLGNSEYDFKASTVAPIGIQTVGFTRFGQDKVSSQQDFGKSIFTYSTPNVTPKTEFSTYTRSGVGSSSSETLQTEPNPFTRTSAAQNLFSKSIYDGKSAASVGVTQKNNELHFGEEIDGVRPPAGSINLPIVTEKSEEISLTSTGLHGVSYNDVTSGQKVSFQNGEISSQPKLAYSIPAVTSKPEFRLANQHSRVELNSGSGLNSVTPTVIPVQSTFGQHSSHFSTFEQSGNGFSSSTPFAFGTTGQSTTPGIFENRNAVSLDISAPKLQSPEPVGSLSSKDYEHGSFGPESSTARYFTQNSAFTNYDQINFKSTFAQPKTSVFVTTPSPAVSITSSPIIYDKHPSTPTSLNKDFFATPQPLFPNLRAIKTGSFNKASTPSPFSQTTFFSSPKSLNFGQTSAKPTNFNQPSSVQSFTPAVQVTTPRPFSTEEKFIPTATTKSAFDTESQVYVTSPVTPKIELFGSNTGKVDQASSPGPVPFRNRIVVEQQSFQPAANQDFEFSKIKFLNTGEQREQQGFENIDYQGQVRVNTFGPKLNLETKTYSPQEEVVHISKSIELNPSHILSGIDQAAVSRQPSTDAPVEIQNQLLFEIPSKTFPNKKVIQPFYKTQSSVKGEEEISSIPRIRNEGQYVFQQQVNIKAPSTRLFEQNRYSSSPETRRNVTLLPAVSYSTAKTIIEEQPAHFAGNGNVSPILPIAHTSVTSGGASITSGTQAFGKTDGRFSPFSESIKDTIKTNSVQPNIFNPSFYVTQEPIRPTFLPVTTQGPQEYLSPLTEEISIQHHTNFEFQKLNKVKNVTPLAPSSFTEPGFYSTAKPLLKFDTSEDLFQYDRGENVTAGSERTFLGPEIKHKINPNIEIPQPPKEYFAQDSHVTVTLPQFSTKSRATYKGLPQSNVVYSQNEYDGNGNAPRVLSGKTLKTSIVSTGNENDGNNQESFDKYSGRFSEVLNKNNQQFGAKIVQEYGTGEVDNSRQEVNSKRQKHRSRGRQYYGGIISSTPATNKYEEYEIERERGSYESNEKQGRQRDSDSSKTTIDLKNLKLDKNKKTVIVVSQVSDANPMLVTKLAGQCSCQSDKLEIRDPIKKSKGFRRKNQNYPEQSNLPQEPVSIFKENERANSAIETVTQGEASNGHEIPSGFVEVSSIQPSSEQSLISSTTAAYEDQNVHSILSSLGPDGVLSITPKTVVSEERIRNRKRQFRGKTRYFSSDSGDGSSLLSAVPASEIANTIDYGVLKTSESKTQNEIEGGSLTVSSKALPGAAFDRYGPGGWRGFDETLQGSVDCKRPGLFRHPKYCNKFYACYYDIWKERYTLHVFNCPIQLTYDSSISACNWPVRGPTCADDNLLI